ncbi:hypothetical protein FPQ18DRAFT_392747 [Pyronema domesticum]|nr:hypothetical protein FPQ18DRAFT_392747 [Pyronema domesticum]
MKLSILLIGTASSIAALASAILIADGDLAAGSQFEKRQDNCYTTSCGLTAKCKSGFSVRGGLLVHRIGDLRGISLLAAQFEETLRVEALHWMSLIPCRDFAR